MPKRYEVLPTVQLNSQDADYCQPMPAPEVAHIDDDALMVMTDFTLHTPQVTTPDDYIPHALAEMKACHVHSLLVVDSQKNVLGLVTNADILGEKPVKIIQERRTPRNEIKVRAIMTPISHLLVFDYETIAHTKVGNVIHTMTDLEHTYALVAQFDEAKHHYRIRGIFSLRKLSDQLGMIMHDKFSEAHSIAELQQKLKHLTSGKL